MMTPRDIMGGMTIIRRLRRKKTFVVTGHRGFILSHFIERLLERGHRVIGIDKLTYASNTEMKFQGDFTEIIADISKIDKLPFCDVIINGAAESHVDNSIAGNDIFLRSNVLGVHNLLELIKNKKLENMMTSWGFKPPLFVQISTDEVFGDILEGSFKEDARHMPSNPYAATKSCAEQLVVSWGRTYDLPYIITRTTNNYGARQHPEKLIPSVITRLLKGERAVVHGGGQYVRNWIHVEDNVDALLAIIDRGEEDQSYHISSPEEYSVEQVVRIICKIMEKDYDDVVDTSTDRSGADLRYALDCRKVRDIGWTPVKEFETELVNIIEFYRKKLCIK